MKKFLLLFALMCTVRGFAQLQKDSIIGVWEYIDKDNKSQKLVITEDSVTVIAQVARYPDYKTWDVVTYTGKYTIINDSTIHVIYWDNPREEQFYHVLKMGNGKMLVQLNGKRKSKLTGERREYTKPE
jgi:hypothetical protein